MSNFRVGQMVGNGRRHARWFTRVIAVLAAATGLPAFAQTAATCPNKDGRTLEAHVVAIDQPLMYNRLGAANINGMMFALKRDVVDRNGVPLTVAGSNPSAGNVSLRPDLRPRPLVLRVAAGDCLTVHFTNLLTTNPNPFETRQNTTCHPNDNGVGVTCTQNAGPRDDRVEPPNAGGDPMLVAPNDQFRTFVDEQVRSRYASFHVNGMQLVDSIASDASYVGKNPSGLAVAAGGYAKYMLYAEKEGVFLAQGYGAPIGSDANQGNASNGLFGQVIVEPKGAGIYRSILTDEEMRLVTTAGKTTTDHPIINYEATYPTSGVWVLEGKAGLPVLNTIQGNEIVHSVIEAMIVGPNGDGSFPPDTYPLESKTYRNPTVPNRLEPFRDLAQVWHDEPSAAQAFPGFYNDPVFGYVLAGVKDGFMINYGSGGIGSEIIANRLGVGPMHDCLACAYEEFFLTSFTVGDPALLVDIPANNGLEGCTPALAAAGQCTAVGPKATKALYPNDPINVHHAYIGDFVKFRNTHVGKEQHVFHLHNHQWLYNPNDDNSNYLDAQGVGPGVGYTYEINFGGAGNRNKSAGDAIFHCHFYPHFAQGMWYHLRNYDTLELGTPLVVSGGTSKAPGFHTRRWALQDGTPQAGARALPDGEIIAGVPLVAIVPLPGKPMAPLPGRVEVVANPTMIPATGRPVGSVAKIDRTDVDAAGNLKNPGYPFWTAGIEDIVGQRPPTPVLDMINTAQAEALRGEDYELFKNLEPKQADGWDGGLPRHALKGYAAGGHTEANVVSARDFTKVIAAAVPVFFPEGGTDVERAAMRFHQKGKHPTSVPKLDGTASTGAEFLTNGTGPVVGAPYHEPCVDDNQKHLTAGVTGNFFSGGPNTAQFGMLASANAGGKETTGSSPFNATTPRRYKGVNIQFDAILNKVGYHYPQQRIITLWEDAVPVIEKQQPPEPLVMRLNTFDCAVFSHSNLVPEYFEMDDYQVRTPTDIIGQHIHLPKWDLTTADGAANGWNYEDGTLSPGAVRERIHAINKANDERVCRDGEGTEILPGAWAKKGYGDVGPHKEGERTKLVDVKCADDRTVSVEHLLDNVKHPYFGQFTTRTDWLGARTTQQRWFADPVVNTDGVDRGLGIIFTHDHYGPSTHQQIGLYATVLTQPAGSTWVHNETGQPFGGRLDGGPTSWQAVIKPPKDGAGTSVQPDSVAQFREFYFEFSDFQHAYEAGVFVGANDRGIPIPPAAAVADMGLCFSDDPKVCPANDPQQATFSNPRINRVSGTTLEESFRMAINPPARQQKNPIYPDLVVEVTGGIIPGCPARPCPQAIDVQDPGMFVVNYRNEPVGLRVFDPGKTGPDGNPGMQADGVEGDLAFALASHLMDKNGVTTPITRMIPALNKTEAQLGFWTKTLNAPDATLGGDPFTPMMRAYAGDMVRVKIQAGAHEEEHNATVAGLKWLQAGSGHGKAPNSGWRNSQAAGISEQFTLAIPMNPPTSTVKGTRDYAYNIDSSIDGWWSGTWGLLRTYDTLRADLVTLDNNANVTPERVVNRDQFSGVCPAVTKVVKGKNEVTILNLQKRTVIAILANDLLPSPGTGVTVAQAAAAAQHVGGPLKGVGSLVYNPRTTAIPVSDIDGNTLGGHAGPLHDPTAMLYVDVRDVEPVNPRLGACKDSGPNPGVTNGNCPIRLKADRKVEPLVIRANANQCVELTVYNRLPALAPDLPTFGTLIGAVKRDRNGLEGSIPFDNNLIRPSSHVGIAPQLVAVDTMDDLGLNVGVNVTQTVPPVDALGKSGKGVFKWYMGDLSWIPEGNGRRQIATPIEFGGSGLAPADRIKQGQKSLVGGLVVTPEGAIVAEDPKSRAQATVTANGKTFRDFMLVMTKHVSMHYADGAPVEHMNGEGVGIPEDSQEASGMALNYGIEPLWFRLGIAPNAPFGGAGCGAPAGAPEGTLGSGCYGSVDKAEQAYSNTLVTGKATVTCNGSSCEGDPATPIFTAQKGQEVRIHSAVPHGTSRGTTFAFHGHVWQRDPYVCPKKTQPDGTITAGFRNGLEGACSMTEVGSSSIGNNPMGFAQGAQESNTPLSHFTYRFPSAGGANGIVGDYLFRDQGSFGNASGLWGILRVE